MWMQHPRFWGGHDAGACLLDDDDILAVAEEERFSRQKHAPAPSFPEKSISYVLSEADLSIADIEVIAIGREPKLFHQQLRENARGFMNLIPWGLGRKNELFWRLVHGGSHLFDRKTEKIAKARKACRQGGVEQVAEQINDSFESTFSGEYMKISHHRCHAATARYCSGLVDPITLTLDGSGEYEATVFWDENLNKLRSISNENSLGRFYYSGVQFLGYDFIHDSGKVMGLAPYGEYRADFEQKFDKIAPFGGGEYSVKDCTVARLEELFGPSSDSPADFAKREKDFAYHLQRRTERIVCDLVRNFVEERGTSELCLAGGLAMNCKMNREVTTLQTVDELFVQPAANDSGICLGAALEAYRLSTGQKPNVALDHLYWGPRYDTDDIARQLRDFQLEFEQPKDIAERAAELLARGHTLGWFQGRMEYGPRALGNRSILANPQSIHFREKVNRIKSREPWRPFAPSMTYESRNEYLEHGDYAPFMILLDEVREDRHDEIPAVTHVDGTTRPQIVKREINPKFHRLLEAFEARTGTPVLLNTSFNVSGEPIVESPRQAVADFYTTELDALAIGDCLLVK